MTNLKSTKKALMLSVLSLVLCFAMLIGTTFAWFTDSVTSANNVIKSGNLDIELEYWTGTEWKTVQGASDILTNELWEPGVTEVAYLRIANAGSLALKYQLGINIIDEIAGVNVAGEHFLLSDYIQFGVVEGIGADATTKVPTAYATREDAVKAVKAAKKISAGYTKISEMAAGDELYLALVVYMPTTVGNEANHNGVSVPQIDLGINVFATQYTYEEDSFDKWYDGDAFKPVASVNGMGGMSVIATEGIGGDAFELGLDVAYTFMPNETLEQAQQSAYRYWHADFVVTIDRDVKAETAYLAGYYSAWCELIDHKWVAMTGDLPANTEVRLVEMLGATVNYEEICRYAMESKDEGKWGFQCGAGDINDALAGATLNVELRLYETTGDPSTTTGPKNEETGNYITVGAYSYTFGKSVSTAEQLKSVLATGGKAVLAKDIELANNETLTVANGTTAVIDLNGHKISATADKTGNQEAFLVKGNLTVENGSMEMTAANNQGWGAMVTIFDVTAGGVLTLNGVNAEVSGSDMNFIVHLNNWGSATLNVTDCDFIASYVAVRAFNSGNDMNTVTIKNTDVHGGRLFWVHNYTAEGKGDSTLSLDIYDNGNTSNNAKPIRFGFDNEVYYDLNGNKIG